MNKRLNAAERRTKRTKGNCHLTHGADAYEKPELNSRRRELDEALCQEGLLEMKESESESVPKVGDKLCSTQTPFLKRSAVAEVIKVEGSKVTVNHFEQEKEFVIDWNQTHYWMVLGTPK